MNLYDYEMTKDLDEDDILYEELLYQESRRKFHNRQRKQFRNEREAGDAELYYHQQAFRTRLERQ